jgi:acetolactate synthase-1/2/3 large subunit
VDAVIAKARAINDRPVVIDFIVGADAQVWPMVAAGTGNDEIMAARGIRPLFDEDETVGSEPGLDDAMEREQAPHPMNNDAKGTDL